MVLESNVQNNNALYLDPQGREKNGGRCRPMVNIHSMFRNNPGKTLAKFKQDILKYKTTRAAWQWEDSDFEGFDKFLDGTVTEENFEFGYGCSSMVESKPARPTFVKGISSITQICACHALL